MALYEGTATLTVPTTLTIPETAAYQIHYQPAGGKGESETHHQTRHPHSSTRRRRNRSPHHTPTVRARSPHHPRVVAAPAVPAKPVPKPSRLTEQITRRADAVLDHVALRVTDLREEQQRGTTEWVQSELDRTAEWIVRLRAEQQDEFQREASAWLAREMESVSPVVMGSARDTFLRWLGGEEGWVTALLAWIPVVWGVGSTVKVGMDLWRVVGGLVVGGLADGGSRGRGRGRLM